jgi:hypothetical protein
MKLYKVILTILIVIILIGFDSFEKYPYAKQAVLQKNKFEGEIIYDRAYGGLHIFKIGS